MICPDCGGIHLPNNAYNAPVDIDKIMDSAIARVYNGKLKAGDIDPDLWKSNTESMWKAVKEGWGVPKGLSMEHARLLELRSNVNTFAAFKNHANVVDVTLQLFDENGNERNFKQFKEAVSPLMDKYNKNYLKAEYELAQKSSASAAEWMELEDSGDMLEYFAIMDGATRQDHALLNGTILPATDPFWQQFYPPNGWGCRCYARRRRAANATQQYPKSVPELQQSFRNNVGTSRQVFTDEHPFIRSVEKSTKERIKQLAESQERTFERKYIYNTLKENMKQRVIELASNDFKAKINITNTGIKEILNQPSNHIIAKNRALFDLPRLVKEAEYVSNSINMNEGQPNVIRWHYFRVNIGGNFHYLNVREFKNNRFDLYSITDKIKK